MTEAGPKAKSRWKRWAALFMAACSLFGVIGGALAYQTDITAMIKNPFTIALDCTTTVVEKFPPPDPEDPPDTPPGQTKPPTIQPTPNGNILQYEKAVQIANTGYIDCYVRVRLDFSEEDVANKSSFSQDGTNWFTWAQFKQNVERNGWSYNSADGYFYYKDIVYAQNWDKVSGKLTYDKKHGEWFYPTSAKDIIADRCITKPLIRYVKTTFASPKDMRTYELNVYEESVPYYFGNSCRNAWDNYLASMK